MVSVYTVGEICKKCYSCVRSCPTKALQVREGQAEIIEDFCISCGYCVNVCSQGAKRVVSSLPEVRDILADRGRKYALLAPSFPAAFLDPPPERLVGALHAAGFDGVYEVAFGADLVAHEYAKLFQRMRERGSEDFLISTPCPAVVQYVEKVLPELAPHLAGIVSPMEATARVVRQMLAADPGALRLVFIGPCVAKKVEAWRSADVDAVLTFAELAELFSESSIVPETAAPADFRPPHGNLGRIYPVTGGLLKAAAIDADILESPVYVVEGAERAMEMLGVLSNRVKIGRAGELPSLRSPFLRGLHRRTGDGERSHLLRAQEVRGALHAEPAAHPGRRGVGRAARRLLLRGPCHRVPSHRARRGGCTPRRRSAQSSRRPGRTPLRTS